MLLTISLSGPDAGALGHLLHKHPDRVQTFSLPVGEATVFYPESGPERTTAALLLEVDPIGMVKRRLRTRDGLSLTDYVTDRPYAASSMFAVALGRVFNTAMNGRSDSFPDLAAKALPLQVRVPAVPVRSGGRASVELVRGLFEPLGWVVTTTEAPFGPQGSWRIAPYVDVTLTGEVRLADALTHLYVLLPVLDNAKHYWVSSDEVAKLVRRGEGWLAEHPQRDLIVRRYLASRRSYVEDATARLAALDDTPEEEPEDDSTEPESEPSTPLRVQRLDAVIDVVHEIGAQRVVDLGCGEGFYLRAFLADPTITEVVGVDVSPRVLERAERRLGLDRMSDRQRAKLTLRQSSATYRDELLAGFDVVCLIEVIEHLELDRIDALESSVFDGARPRHVLVTTPNREYNAVYGLAEGSLRHPDHRFEWTRAEFASWCESASARHGYRVAYRDIGDVDRHAGPPTQLALFTREDQ